MITTPCIDSPLFTSSARPASCPGELMLYSVLSPVYQEVLTLPFQTLTVVFAAFAGITSIVTAIAAARIADSILFILNSPLFFRFIMTDNYINATISKNLLYLGNFDFGNIVPAVESNFAVNIVAVCFVYYCIESYTFKIVIFVESVSKRTS